MKTFKTLLKAISVCIALVMSVAALPSAVYAQKYEVHPYAGGFFPGPNGTLGDFRSEGIYGVKSGVFRHNELPGRWTPRLHQSFRAEQFESGLAKRSAQR